MLVAPSHSISYRLSTELWSSDTWEYDTTTTADWRCGRAGQVHLQCPSRLINIYCPSAPSIIFWTNCLWSRLNQSLATNATVIPGSSYSSWTWYVLAAWCQASCTARQGKSLETALTDYNILALILKPAWMAQKFYKPFVESVRWSKEAGQWTCLT